MVINKQWKVRKSYEANPVNPLDPFQKDGGVLLENAIDPSLRVGPDFSYLLFHSVLQ